MVVYALETHQESFALRNFRTLTMLGGVSPFCWQNAIYCFLGAVPRPRRVRTRVQTRVEPYVRVGSWVGGTPKRLLVEEKKSVGGPKCTGWGS